MIQIMENGLKMLFLADIAAACRSKKAVSVATYLRGRCPLTALDRDAQWVVRLWTVGTEEASACFA